jgi:hypothetical protein
VLPAVALRRNQLLKQKSGHSFHAQVRSPGSRFSVLPSFFLLPSPRFPLRTMSLSSWSDACNTARNKPQHTLLDAANASCGVTVSWAAAAGTHGNNVRRLRRFA